MADAWKESLAAMSYLFNCLERVTVWLSTTRLATLFLYIGGFVGKTLRSSR